MNTKWNNIFEPFHLWTGFSLQLLIKFRTGSKNHMACDFTEFPILKTELEQQAVST